MGAMTVTLKSSDAWLSLGNRRGVIASMTGSTSYATNGDTYTARNFGLGTIDRLQIISEPKGYAIKVDQTNSKVIYSDTSGFTPAGTVAAPVLTMNSYTPAGTVAAPTLNAVNVTVTGGQAAGAALQILPDSAAGVLGKTTATTFNIPQATLGIPVATANAPAFTGTPATLTGTNSAPAFTGTAVAAGLFSEVASTTDISAQSFDVIAWGW